MKPQQQDNKVAELVNNLNNLNSEIKSGKGLLTKLKFNYYFFSFLRKEPYSSNAEIFNQHASPDLKKTLGMEVKTLLAENHPLLQSINPYLENEAGYKIRDLFATSKTGREILQKKGFSDDSIKASLTRLFLDISYSRKDFVDSLPPTSRMRGMREYSLVYKMIEEQLDDITFSRQDVKNLFEKIIKNKHETFSTKDYRGDEVKILNIPYSDHASYAIIDYRNKTPAYISLCNTSYILESPDGKTNYGETRFEIDEEKLGQGNILKSIKKFISQINFSGEDPANHNKLKEILKQFVVCDEKGEPLVVERNIPTKKQKRGNCSFKSLNIIFRSMMERLDPELKFELDGQGGGQKIYEEYKEQLINNNINSMLELLKKENCNEDYYPQLLKTAQEVCLFAAKKCDVERLKKIIPALKEAGVKVDQIGGVLGINTIISNSGAKPKDIGDALCVFYNAIDLRYSENPLKAKEVKVIQTPVTALAASNEEAQTTQTNSSQSSTNSFTSIAQETEPSPDCSLRTNATQVTNQSLKSEKSNTRSRS